MEDNEELHDTGEEDEYIAASADISDWMYWIFPDLRS